METIIKKGFLILLCGLALSLPSYALLGNKAYL